MTCKQLGGACDVEFHANSFEEMAEMSKNHGTEMFKAGDVDHLKAMSEMKTLMQTPGAMQKWFDEKRKAFDEMPDEN